MTREIRAAIRDGINEADLKGYKWSITPSGLKWSYGEEFTFSDYPAESLEDEGIRVLRVTAVQSGMDMVTMLVGKPWYCDSSDMLDAYRVAAEYTIRRANELY